jgi:phenylpyruvate tautomerase PptA (4-oxalocrotonate tautomerase family)
MTFSFFQQIASGERAAYLLYQIQLTREVTDVVAKHSGDPSQGRRTWVLLSEAAEGGWGIAGTAYGKEEFGALERGVFRPSTPHPI